MPTFRFLQAYSVVWTEALSALANARQDRSQIIFANLFIIFDKLSP
jgi:hypothetical protein